MAISLKGQDFVDVLHVEYKNQYYKKISFKRNKSQEPSPQHTDNTNKINFADLIKGHKRIEEEVVEISSPVKVSKKADRSFSPIKFEDKRLFTEPSLTDRMPNFKNKGTKLLKKVIKRPSAINEAIKYTNWKQADSNTIPKQEYRKTTIQDDLSGRKISINDDLSGKNTVLKSYNVNFVK